MARDLDANLAQVDMEDFRTEDIHSFLHGLPQICCTDVHVSIGDLFHLCLRILDLVIRIDQLNCTF